MHNMRPALLLAAAAAIAIPPQGLFVSATCYFRDGSIASSYQACPGNSQFCCKLTGTCATNGLCMDSNNYGNGTLADLGNGNYYNQTGLYQTPACVNQDFNGCDTHCTNSTNKGFLYAWGCNDGMTSYCCHTTGLNIFKQMDCCSDGTPRFTLPSATPLPWSLTKTATTSSTSSISSSAGTSTPSGATSTAATTTGASTATGSSPVTEKELSSALSTGAAVGIGIGVAIAVLLIILVALVWRIQRRKKGIPLRPLPPTDYTPAPSYYAALGSSHETPDDFDGLGAGGKGFRSPHIQSQSPPPPAIDLYPQEHKPLVEADGQQMLFEMEGRNRGVDPRELP